MASEFHHNIRRYAVGEGEADEGLSAGVGADEFVFGVDFVVADAVAVAGDGVLDENPRLGTLRQGKKSPPQCTETGKKS